LDQLAARPEAVVLFAEGEKAADAGQRLFPDFVAVTTMNGSQSPGKTDFTPFAGRKVYIAPDNDESGMNYVTKLIELLRGVNAEVVGVMNVAMLIKDGALAKGYDLADAEVEGWTIESLAGLGAALWSPVMNTAAANETLASQCSGNAQAMKAPAVANEFKKTARQFASEFAEVSYGNNIAYFNNQVVAYENGYWPALNIDVHIKKPLLEAMDIKATASKVNGVVEVLKIMHAAMPEQFERKTDRPLICLNNGTLDPISGELLQHSAEHFLSNKLDITHDVAAQCPIWIKTLNEIFQPDADKVEKIQLLQEFIGYCLIPDTTYPQFLWMVGEGGNGKSLILNVMTALVGKENISYAQLEDLDNPFVRAELQGKLLSMSSEMSSSATISDGYLKQLTSGDLIQAERKNERPFSFKSYARIVGATNTLPRLLDHSGGFGRRAMIMRLNRVFTEAEQDKGLEAKILNEMPGILNWAIQGLQNLLSRKSYAIPDSCRIEVQQYRVNSDPIKLFAAEYLRKCADKQKWVKSGALYESYKDWSRDNGYKTLASNQFADRLTGAGFTKDVRKDGRFWNAEYSSYFPSGEEVPVPVVPVVASISPLAGKWTC
jgi:putative DNA primase/helicase